MTAYATIRVERDRRLRGLVTITLARPEKLNAIDDRMHDELQAACHALQSDAAARIVILTGEGRAFSAGSDLRPARQPKTTSDLERRLRVATGNRTAAALEALDQVTIAAVNGLAIGGGVVLAAACDLRLAGESAWFSIPEVDLDLPMTWNSLPMLMRELGPARTKELVMTCDRFSARDAERWGFVNHVYDDGRVLVEARALAKRLLAKDAMSLALTKSTTRALAHQLLPPEATTHDRDLLLLSDLLRRQRLRDSRN